jgi:hypothetical protein
MAATRMAHRIVSTIPTFVPTSKNADFIVSIDIVIYRRKYFG